MIRGFHKLLLVGIASVGNHEPNLSSTSGLAARVQVDRTPVLRPSTLHNLAVAARGEAECDDESGAHG